MTDRDQSQVTSRRVVGAPPPAAARARHENKGKKPQNSPAIITRDKKRARPAACSSGRRARPSAFITVSTFEIRTYCARPAPRSLP
ncbi:hypothetical protein EVAR_25589_1 [Eumeta japonica]|uniref:Uncharacterized protein n=1 Tax=Eumeta variegata TaxID=151549 RepID=A0A4C1V256_EUMVA|nr:hypothetical protein EVAR_25589_1 [Eumeta japonica]